MAGQTHVITVDPTTRKVELVPQGDIAAGGGGGGGTPDDNSVTNAKMADVATNTIKGRKTAGTGDPEDLTPADVRTMINVEDGATANAPDATLLNRANHTGTQDAATITGLEELVEDIVGGSLTAGTNVTITYDDAAGTHTISAATGAPAADSVTNVLLANMAESTIKGRATAGTGDPEDLTAAQVRTILNVADGATANSPDSALLDRANHTGTQDAATITGLSEVIDDRVATLAVAGSGMTITYDDVANTLTFDSSVAATGSFVAAGTGAVTRTTQQRLRETGVYVTDYFNAGTDGTNYSPALTRAFAVSPTVFWPEGDYTMSTRVAYPDNARLVGLGGRVFSDDVGGTKITANAGFLYNNYGSATGAARRKRIHVSGFSINGNYTAGTVGIDGPFGGVIEEMRIADYPVGIQNAAGFLCDYDRLCFDGSTARPGSIALSMADANGVSITRSFFDAIWDKHISTVDVTPMTGSDNGMAIYIARNNFNCKGSVNPDAVLLDLSGNIFGVNNYFEDYTTDSTPSGCVFVRVKANAFAGYGLTWIHNEMNGSGTAKHAVQLYSSRAAGSGGAEYGGLIGYNRMLGFNTTDRPAIQFGGVGGSTTDNSVRLIKISDNITGSSSSSVVVGNRYARSLPHPLTKSSWSGATTSISGTTYVTLPIGSSKAGDLVDGFGSSTTTYTARKAGRYRITVAAQAQSTAASFGNVELRIVVNGAEVASTGSALNFVASPTTLTLNLDTIENVDFGQTITVQARGNSASAITCPKGTFTCEWIGDGNE